MRVPITKSNEKNLRYRDMDSFYHDGFKDVEPEKASDIDLARVVTGKVFLYDCIVASYMPEEADRETACSEWRRRFPKRSEIGKWWAQLAHPIAWNIEPSPEERAEDRRLERERKCARLERVRKALARWTSGKCDITEVGHADLLFLAKYTGEHAPLDAERQAFIDANLVAR